MSSFNAVEMIATVAAAPNVAAARKALARTSNRQLIAVADEAGVFFHGSSHGEPTYEMRLNALVKAIREAARPARMSHAKCVHPKTNAARAACRKINQPSANGRIYGCDYCGAEKTSLTPLTYACGVGCPARPTEPVTFYLANGREVSVRVEQADRFRGLDADGNKVISVTGGGLVSLTPCCDATGKGSDGVVVCRACYREVDDSFGGPAVVANPVAPPFGTRELSCVGLDGTRHALVYAADNAPVFEGGVILDGDDDDFIGVEAVFMDGEPHLRGHYPECEMLTMSDDGMALEGLQVRWISTPSTDKAAY